MRALKYLVATIATLFAGWLLSGVLPWLLGFFGDSLASRSKGLSVRLLSYLILGLALPWLSARLVTPADTNVAAGQSELRSHKREFQIYLRNWLALALLVAFVLPLIELVLLDSGLM